MEQLKDAHLYDILETFQEFKKSLGYQYNNMSSFYQLEKLLKEKGVTDWKDFKTIFEVAVLQEKNVSKQKERYYCLKELKQFLEIFGYKDLYFVEMRFPNTSDFTPTILTIEEVFLFFEGVDTYSKQFSTNEKYIYPVLFRLLYSCGLRINEALNLKVTDLSIETGILIVRAGKGNITRSLPLEDSMLIVLKQYLEKVHPKKYLFEKKHKPFPYYKAQCFFKQVTQKMRNFRIHDLRHTFAVHSFDKLYRQGYKEYWILLYLCVYMGHTKITSTEYYLHFTEFGRKQFLKTSKKFSNIIPKVGVKNEL